MAELLIELFSEEIPARMQAKAAEDLKKMLADRFAAAGLNHENLESFSGPRRIGAVAENVGDKTADVREERKGPRVGAPDKAVQGFLRGAGLDSLDQCKIESGPKGEFYVALIEKPGRPAAEVIAEALTDIVKSFPWPKSMKFGEGERAQRWVRPLHSVICLLDGKKIPMEIYGIAADSHTLGHRIHSVGDPVLTVSGYDDYEAKLRANGVILDREERAGIILDGARKVCAEAGLELVEDDGLLAEVAGLAEWPVPILGHLDPAVLDLPPEVVALTMKVHQKYFAVRDPQKGSEPGKLAPNFVVVANQDAPDGGVKIAQGAARVAAARLADARHFWDLDRTRGLEAMAAELGKVTFHEKLGTVADKTERVAALARELAEHVGADPRLAERAARLSKADLVSQMVYEFPELQGVMGWYYALEAGEPAEIADAIRDHYKPQGPSDAVPAAPVSAAVALADKLDTLVGFWAIDEKPTGSKDPFALRRAALGVIRIIANGRHKLAFDQLIEDYLDQNTSRTVEGVALSSQATLSIYIDVGDHHILIYSETTSHLVKEDYKTWGNERHDAWISRIGENLLAFFADRLKVHLREDGVRHDVIDAVFALGDDDLVRVTAKSRALQSFLDGDDGAALLSGYRRAANILRAEEKKGFDLGAALDAALRDAPLAPSGHSPRPRGETPGGEAGSLPPPAGGVSRSDEGGSGEAALTADQRAALSVAIAATAREPEEKALIAALEGAEEVAKVALENEDFEGAMTALAGLREPVDAFFDKVTVNAEDETLRRNRLLLLSRIRSAVRQVADFDRLDG